MSLPCFRQKKVVKFFRDVRRRALLLLQNRTPPILFDVIRSYCKLKKRGQPLKIFLARLPYSIRVPDALPVFTLKPSYAGACALRFLPFPIPPAQLTGVRSAPNKTNRRHNSTRPSYRKEYFRGGRPVHRRDRV